MLGVLGRTLYGVERAYLRKETFGAVEVTIVEAVDDCELVERAKTLVYVRFDVIRSLVFEVVELLEIVGQLVKSGGLFNVVVLEKLRGHSAKLTGLAKAVLATNAHT